MHELEIIYLGFIAVGMCIAYVVIFFLFQGLFKSKMHGLVKKSFHSLGFLVALSAFTYFVTFYLIPDKIVANRFLHAFGGGATVFIICLLAVKDSKLSMPRPIFFFIGFLIVTILGLFNEVAEIFLQNRFHVILSPGLADTLLDLLSNTVGFLVASLCLIRRIPSAYPLGQRRSAALR